MRKRFSKEEIKDIINKYLRGMSQKDIGKLYNTYNTSIRRVLLRHNIKLRSNREVQSVVKTDIFKKIDNNVEYLIGILATDGCVLDNNSIILELQEQDLEFMQKYQKWIKYPVNIVTSIYKDKYKCYRIGFKSLENCNTLKSYGIIPRKTKKLELKIPLTFNILRGIIDGDGSISHTNRGNSLRIEICTASEKFANQIFNFLTTEQFNPTLTCNNKLYSINLYRKKEIESLYNKLYTSDTYLFLKRKKDKYGRLLKKLNK